MTIQLVTYNDHLLQAVEFTGYDSVDLMDKAFGEEFMDRSETNKACTELYLYNKNGSSRAARIGDYIMRTNRGKLFICGWRDFRSMYASPRAA